MFLKDFFYKKVRIFLTLSDNFKRENLQKVKLNHNNLNVIFNSRHGTNENF